MIREKLFSYENKIIAVEELMHLAGEMDYADFAGLVHLWVADKILEPVKSARKNGRRPPLYNKYRILKPKSDYSGALEDIKLLHPTFNHAKYAQHPEMYVKYKKEIDLLSKFLWENEELLKEPVSMNERSFQIWGAEKLLKEKSIIQSIFQFNGWDLSSLNYYETPEPFFEYNFSRAGEMNILLIENKDTWFSLRKIMREDGLNHLFREYHVLLYGEGKKIISRNNRLKEYNDLLKGSENRYYYFGDLDYEGIEIYQTLAEKNRELKVSLCTELYLWMLTESRRYDLPRAKTGQKKADISAFLSHFHDPELQEIKDILENGRYIPQEILNYQLLKRKMLEDRKLRC